MSVSDLETHLDLLRGLDRGLSEIPDGRFSGLSFCLHRPGSAPLDPLRRADSSRGWISDDGILNVVVDEDSLVASLKSFDLDRAALFTRLHGFWERRAAELKQSVKELLKVEDMLCDTSTGANAQRFVLWAGNIMANKEEVGTVLRGSKLPSRLLVHCDQSAPMADYSSAAATLHIRTDCPLRHFLEFVQSEVVIKAGEEVKEMLVDDLEEQRVFEEARRALGAKQVIRICSIYDRPKAIEAAKRLIENSESIRQSVDLSEAGIAIDSSYDSWESGYISIPFDYEMKDLKPRLTRLIGSGKAKSRKPPVKTSNCFRGFHACSVRQVCRGRNYRFLEASTVLRGMKGCPHLPLFP